MASPSAEASLNRWPQREQEAAKIRDQLSTTVPTSSVDAEPHHDSLHKELAAANVMIGKLGAEVRTGRDQLEYNRHRASDQYLRAVGDRLNSEFSHTHEVLTCKKRVDDLESNESAQLTLRRRLVKGIPN